MKIVFLGTNGWYDTATGNTICILIETNDFYIIFDAGNGLYKADRYIKDNKPAHMFLSHFHLDHICGLHILNKFKFKKGLKIFGPAGTKSILNMIVNKPFTVSIDQLPYEVGVFELPEDTSALPFSVETKTLLHSSLTLGYRLEVDGKIVVYCPDTGYCENAVKLAKNADLLIAECAYKSGQSDEKWPHLNPETAAQLAKEANAKQLALVHFDAELYKNQDDRKSAEKVARAIFGNTVSTMDELSLRC